MSAVYPPHPILIVDDEEVSLLLTTAVLRKAGLNNVISCRDSRNVQDILSKEPVVLILLDLLMPHISGEELLSIISRDFPDIPTIVVTGKEDVETAVRCIKMGAIDYVIKPVEQGRLRNVIRNVLAVQGIKQNNSVLRDGIYSSPLKNAEAFAEIVTNNNKMISLFQYVESIAHTSEPVLITGETGVGKGLIARAIYTLSNRKGPFIAVNVAGLDDNMFSDTLFGHAKGAFTGADRARSGLVEKASYGTLFLDEIGDLTPGAQAKLLRLLQEGDYLPLGQDLAKHSTARIISATNQDLWVLTKQGMFRKDLNYRLRTHHIHIPPLRERVDDIALLIDHFLEKASKELNKKKPKVTDELLALLEAYHFPGNVRELRAMIFNAMSMVEAKTLSQKMFETHIAQEQQNVHSPREEVLDTKDPIVFSSNLPTLKQANELLVNEAMKRSKGNQSLAGRLLGISQQAVSKRLKSSDSN